MSEPIRIEAEDNDRFSRFGLITWWDQAKLSAAKVVVIGAGALGNEIVKNLALLGVGNVLICDKDTIEHSNLSRSVLFREKDNGRFKADVAAETAREIYPAMNARPFVGDVIHGLGAGVFRWADAVICGLDNREARLTVNRHCFRFGVPWIDGAMEQINGVARVFVPDGHPAAAEPDQPCYECTMSQRDWQLLQHRRSCNGLSRDEMAGGRTPTTPTIGSIIAGLQCQELLKLLHGLPTIAGSGVSVVGASTDIFPTKYSRKPDCPAHDRPAHVIELDASAETMTARELLARGEGASVDLGRDLLAGLTCAACDETETVRGALSSLPPSRLNCPTCGRPRRVETFHTLRGDEPFLDETLATLGVPPFDIALARRGNDTVGLLLAADETSVLGELAGETLELA